MLVGTEDRPGTIVCYEAPPLSRGRFPLYRALRDGQRRLQGGCPRYRARLYHRGHLVGIDVDHAAQVVNVSSLEALGLPLAALRAS